MRCADETGSMNIPTDTLSQGLEALTFYQCLTDYFAMRKMVTPTVHVGLMTSNTMTVSIGGLPLYILMTW